ncbi:hypothetical protein ACJJJB_20670 [Microbulbifer sp. ANSA001]|uniref:hypothetical protein n=1 Tax=Microbulbifer sp. ANSA001 TaxID=3243358 RepID=UPI004041636A
MWKKGLLAVGITAAVLHAGSVMGQDMPSDLDLTLTVVEETEDALDVMNNIELPPNLQEIAEETMAAVMAAVAAAREEGGRESEELEGIVNEAMARHQELIANARLSAEAAREEALRAAETAREGIEEAVKSALSGAEIQGVIEQMMQDILDSLPADIREQITVDLNALFEQARENLPEDSDT